MMVFSAWYRCCFLKETMCRLIALFSLFIFSFNLSTVFAEDGGMSGGGGGFVCSADQELALPWDLTGRYRMTLDGGITLPANGDKVNFLDLEVGQPFIHLLRETIAASWPPGVGHMLMYFFDGDHGNKVFSVANKTEFESLREEAVERAGKEWKGPKQGFNENQYRCEFGAFHEFTQWEREGRPKYMTGNIYLFSAEFNRLNMVGQLVLVTHELLRILQPSSNKNLDDEELKTIAKGLVVCEPDVYVARAMSSLDLPNTTNAARAQSLEVVRGCQLRSAFSEFLQKI